MPSLLSTLRSVCAGGARRLSNPPSAEGATPHTPEADTFRRVCEFLRGEGTDHKGRTLAFILAQDDAWLEDQHDFVQWAFPGTLASIHNPFAPTLDAAQLRQLGADLLAREGLLAAYARMLQFLGLADAAGTVSEVPRPPAVVLPPAWMRRPDHNDLRISRILACLTGAGLHREAQALLAFLEKRFAKVEAKAESLAHWRNAGPGRIAANREP